MSNDINLIAFGTFGSPNGFRQTFFTGNITLGKSVKTFDLQTNAIKLFPDNRKVYSIRKEYVNGYNAVAYAVYTFAKEQNSERGGTFIGSGILYTNGVEDENITISNLNEFHKNLIDRNVQNNVITVNHSDKLTVNKPKDFDKTAFHLKEVENLNFTQSSDKNLVVYSDVKPEKLQQLFKKSVDLLNVYDTIYFTDSEEVAKFVNEKGIFKLVQNVGNKTELEQEIQKLAEERKRKIQESLDEFFREKQRLEDSRKKTYEEFKSQIEKNKEKHRENDQKIKESEKDLNKINDFYNSFSRKIDELSNQLKSGSKKLDDVKQIYNDNKRVFRESIGNLKTPNFINSVSQPRPATDIRETVQTKHTWGNQYDYRSQKKEYKLDIFKAATLALLLIWIGTMVYFLFFNKKEEEVNISEKQQQEDQVQPVQKATSIQWLDPFPNDELNENDYRLVAKKIKYNTKAEEIVKVIFENNPTDIQSSYSAQNELYTKQLIELNKDCFEEKNGVFYFVKDTLRHIPSYKK